jgi:hypothetical protein
MDNFDVMKPDLRTGRNLEDNRWAFFFDKIRQPFYMEEDILVPRKEYFF